MNNQVRKATFQRCSRQDCGMALVIVLASLALLVVLGIAFLSSSTTELRSSTNSSEGARARMLAQSAVSVSLAQITAGTKGIDENGASLAWASQPGMIRTYDEDGVPVTSFRLYSWDKMAADGAFDAGEEANDLLDWHANRAVFTDLNEPLRSGTGKRYPIIDGNNLTLQKTESGKPVLTYDDGQGKASVTGFSVLKDASVVSSNPVPMPVKWLYVLKDGTIVTPSGGSGNLVTFSGSSTPSTENPIVGRIAFWTDDETCKVNINTASEGVYWDSPRLTSLSLDDWLLESNQPVKGEYQRYPGHPAMNSLSPILSGLTAQQIYDLVPYVGSGGSSGGTKRTAWTSDGAPNYSALVADTDRLYTSVDELLFGPTRQENVLLQAQSLEKCRFFLTANNRAPELNLFNKPRVSIWPVHATDNSTFRSAYDSVFAFCSAIRNDLGASRYRFYFQRENAESATVDLPKTGSVTGVGRNRTLLEYLRRLTSRRIPGFGGSFQAKYNSPDTAGIVDGTDRDQILTQIFDYIRATNLADSTLPTKSSWFAKGGQVTPIEDVENGTQGFGRYRTLQGANFLFIGAADSTVTSAVPPVDPANIRVQAVFMPQLFSVAQGAVFLTDSFQVTIEGLDRFEWTAGGVRKSMGYPASIVSVFPDNDEGTPKAPRGGLNWGGQFGAMPFAYQKNYRDYISSTLDAPRTPAPGKFTFHGGDVTFKFCSLDRTVIQTVKLNFPESDFPCPLLANAQHKVGSFGPFDMRSFEGRKAANNASLNNAWWFTTQDVIRSVSATDGDIRLIAARKNPPLPANAKYQFSKNVMYDNLNVPLKWAHNLWSGTGFPYPFALGISGGPAGVPGGKLVANAHYDTTNSQVFPDVPLNGAALGKKISFSPGDIPGDWDTGVAEMKDGSFINKPDEGDIGNGVGTTVTANPYKWKARTGVNIPSTTLFTPNRLIPSPVTFGSLPTGVLADRPWQTLQFRPGPAGHPGLGKPKNAPSTPDALAGMPPYEQPPDHLLLDLFWMPVVEPYPISEPFSTAGKINMNYQIVPFTYLTRKSGLHSLLASEKVISIQTSGSTCNALNYKAGFGDVNNRTPGMSRQKVDVEETLHGFDQRFAAGDIFRSPSEICDIDIVPVDYSGIRPHTRASMDTYWSTRLLTGDNCRERPYATIYPRLTTQSNTYTVHFRAQALKKARGSQQDRWDEMRDVVTGEYRGFQTVERYIDPNNTEMPDPADPSSTVPLSRFYKFRVIQAKQFSP